MGFFVGWKYFDHNDYYCFEAQQERRRLEAIEKRKKEANEKVRREKAEKKRKEKLEKKRKHSQEQEEKREKADYLSYASLYGDKEEVDVKESFKLSRGYGFDPMAAKKRNKPLKQFGYQPPDPKAECDAREHQEKTSAQESGGKALPKLRRPI